MKNQLSGLMKDAWERGWKIGQALAFKGWDARTLYGGTVRDGKYFPMNSFYPLFAIPVGITPDKNNDFLDGVRDGFWGEE